MTKAILAIGLLTVFAVPAMSAQTPTGGRNKPNMAAMVQRQVSHLTILLDLTTAQQSALTTLLTQNATSNQSLFAGMEAARKALHTAETNNDSNGIQTASAQIGTITGQMTANRSILNAGIAQILTPDQMTKYKALGHGGGGWGGRGHGRPGGPGGPGAQ